MTSGRKLIGLLLSAALLPGCAPMPEPSHHAKERAVLKPQRHFGDRVGRRCLVRDRMGEFMKCFSVVTACNRNGSDTHDDDFPYADGTRQRLTRTITAAGRERYLGTAGNALRWMYALAPLVDGKTQQAYCDDGMSLINGNAMLDRLVMSKFGGTLADVTLPFWKRRGPFAETSPRSRICAPGHHRQML